MTKDALIIDYSVYVEQDDTDPADCFATGDDEADRATVAEINRRLDRGAVWAWCVVTVTASVTIDGETFVGRDSLGGCSYADEADFRQPGGVYSDMQDEALTDLHNTLNRVIKRGAVAKRALEDYLW